MAGADRTQGLRRKGYNPNRGDQRSLPREYAVSQYLKPDGPVHAITTQTGYSATTTDYAAIEAQGGQATPLLNGVHSHESYGAGGNIGHQEAIRLALQGGHACGNLNALIDDAAGSPDVMLNRWPTLKFYSEEYVYREINTHWQVRGHYTVVAANVGVTGTAAPGSAHVYGTVDDAPTDTDKSAQISQCIP